MSDDPRDCYGARKPGMPGYAAICVNDPKWPGLAKEIASWFRRGMTVESCTTQEARDGMLQYIDAETNLKP